MLGVRLPLVCCNEVGLEARGSGQRVAIQPTSPTPRRFYMRLCCASVRARLCVCVPVCLCACPSVRLSIYMVCWFATLFKQTNKGCQGNGCKESNPHA